MTENPYTDKRHPGNNVAVREAFGSLADTVLSWMEMAWSNGYTAASLDHESQGSGS